MNISVASAHRATARTEISSRHIDERFAKRGTSGLIADQRRKNIALLQKKPAGYTDRFLAFAEVNTASDQPPR